MILIVNAGSSSIKFKLFDTSNLNNPKSIVEGIAERINVDGRLIIKTKTDKFEFDDSMKNHDDAVQSILVRFKELNLIKDFDDIKGIGFRVVHGGNKILRSVELTEENKKIIEENIKLAPLHNPGALTAITAFEKKLGRAKLVGCFDTAFHQTMPRENYLYATPYSWFQDFSLRKYGFHGISYQYITEKMSEVLKKDKENLNLIVCHLGNGASMCCIKEGKSFDTTMGLTPLAGLIMGTRTGDIDPSILQYMAKQLDKNVEEITDILNKKSGILGLSGISSDMRDITEAIRNGDKQATMALDLYTQKIADFIIKYTNQLNGSVDAIVFTAGIGENAADVRSGVIDKINIIPLDIDEDQNLKSYDEHLEISSAKSLYKILKMRTDEELMICKETLKFL